MFYLGRLILKGNMQSVKETGMSEGKHPSRLEAQGAVKVKVLVMQVPARLSRVHNLIAANMR
jgi:hypothetical protein